MRNQKETIEKKDYIAEALKAITKRASENSDDLRIIFETIVLLIGETKGIKRLLSVLFEHVKTEHPNSKISHVTVDEYAEKYAKKSIRKIKPRLPVGAFLRELVDTLIELDGFYCPLVERQNRCLPRVKA